MEPTLESQRQAFEANYKANLEAYSFHVTQERLTRFLRDRRVLLGVKRLRALVPNEDLNAWTALVVCGGVGGEGILLQRAGFGNVTVSDFSQNSLSIAARLAPQLKTRLLNAESLDLADGSFDLVIVQDGLHHLPRPVLGFTEMLRVARRGVIIVEPYRSLVGALIGTEWEKIGDATNFVFRWDRGLIQQVVKSYLLKNYRTIEVLRIWDHNVVVRKLTKLFPEVLRLAVARLAYTALSPINCLGNMLVGIVLK